MATTKKLILNHTNLAFDLDKIKGYDKPTIKKSRFKNDVHDEIFTIEINDNSYFFYNKEERDADVTILKELLKK